MFAQHSGEFAALLTAVFWTVTALAFEYASKRVGSLQVNILRLCLGFVFLSLFNWIRRGLIFPADASAHAWGWLSLSGLIGFTLGDLFLFESFTIIGSRLSMLIMTLVPPITALLGLTMLGERLSLLSLAGMVLTLTGIMLAVFRKGTEDRKAGVTVPVRGILFAFGGAVGQAVGLIFSKIGMGTYDAFAASQIRILTGIAGFVVVIFVWKRWGAVWKATKDPKSMRGVAIGSFFGPFLGVSFSLFAVQHAVAGVASTIMAMTPVLIIAPSVWIFRQKAGIREIIGAFLSVLGVALFFV